MSVGKFRALGSAIALAAAAAVLGGCGSDGGDAAGGSLPADTAEELAAMSDGIADALEAGDTCDAAHRADELQTAVSEADIPDDLRDEVEAGADQLVNGVNCESDEDRTTTKDEGGEGDEDENGGSGDEESGDSGSSDEGSSPPGQSEEFVPPGQQGKIKGGI